MTDLLLRLFTPGEGKPTDPAYRASVGKLSGAVGIGCNLLLFAGKLAVGTLAGSMSITADAMNNLSDATSSIVTLFGFRLAEQPADEEHPYGHARFEYLSGLAVAAMILLIGFELAKGSFHKLLHPAATRMTWVTALVLVMSIAVKLWMAAFNKKLGKLIGSQALEATAADSRNDVLSTTAVLTAGVIELLTSWRVDGLMGLAVAAFILCSGWELAKQTISPLLGEGADPWLRENIVDYVSSFPQVLGYHDLMVHDYGPGQRFATLHVEMDSRADPLRCHELIDDMERECLESHGVHLVIHYDPVVTDDPELDRLRELVKAHLARQDSRLTIHDFRMVPGKEHTNLVFDVALPADLRDLESTIQRALEAELNAPGDMTYHTVITFDAATFN